MLWIEDRRLVITGDSLADFGRGLEVPPEGTGLSRAELAETLAPLLARPIDLVLPAHGVPAPRDTLDRALG
ncbi:hypothetical protein [Kribbella sp. NPDC051770]|uniref:hypothetical protein n=1 Tax=Kribbella sp. NPDC051770 TaxID=3155413 RepID=UPI00342B9EE9